MTFKAVILVGGPQKGTRFRPLSLQLPKPLFPIAGVPLVEHHIDQLSQLTGLSEIILLGFYAAEQFTEFTARCQNLYRILIRYIEEAQPMGTAGGLVNFRNTILAGSPEAVFVLNADVCGDLPVPEMVERISSLGAQAKCLLLTTEATRQQSTNFGSVVIAADGKVLHYVDKPTTFVSTHISCGVYLMRPEVIKDIEPSQSWFETDVFPYMAAQGSLYAFHTTRWWSQTKTAAAVLYANRHYLRLYKHRYAARLCTDTDRATIIGDVFIDPSAEVDPSAKIGPNVSIGANAKIGKGVRIKESIILPDVTVEEYACVMHSVVGWRSVVGRWARVEGIPLAPNPNVPFAKLENKPLFLPDGRLNPSVTILGSDVSVAPETIVLNCVVLPYKELSTSAKNQIIL